MLLPSLYWRHKPGYCVWVGDALFGRRLRGDDFPCRMPVSFSTFTFSTVTLTECASSLCLFQNDTALAQLTHWEMQV